MKQILATVAVFTLVACSGAGAGEGGTDDADDVTAPSPITAEDVTSGLVEAGLPLTDIEVFTAESDPNNMMGRPGGYASKVNFMDSRHSAESEMSRESTIEVFEKEADATARREYVEEVTRGTPFLTQYIYQQGGIVLRLDRSLLPDEAQEYEAALSELSR